MDKIKKGIFNWLRKDARQPFVASISSKYQGMLGLQSQVNTLQEYKNWVYACVRARAKAVSDIQLKLMRGDEEVTSHEVLDLLNRVNDRMTKRQLFKATQSFLDLDGNAYWFLARDNDGKGNIKEIYPLRPDRMRIVLDDANPLLVKGYVYKLDAQQQIPFSANEILHLYDFNPLGNHPLPHKGMGIVQAAAYSIDTDNEARQWNYKFFKNSARPDVVLYSDGEGVMGSDEHKRVQEEWTETFGGSDNSHKVAVLSGGLKMEQLTRTQIDMDFVNQRTFSRDEILSMFETPKSIIGITDDVNRANAEASVYVFMKNTVKPLMEDLTDLITELLIKPIYGDDLKLTFHSPVPDDRAQVIAEYSAGIDKWLSRNEIRAKEGYAPTQNGDAFQGSFSNIEVDRVTAPTKSVQGTQVKKKSVGKKSGTESLVDDFIGKLPTIKELRLVPEDIKTKYISLWKANLEANTAPLRKKLSAYFEKQKKEVLKNLVEEFKGLEAKEYKLKSLDDVLFDEEDEVTAGISLITPFLRSYLLQSGNEAAKLVDISFNVESPAIQKFIKDRAKYFAETVNETTADELMTTLRQGVKDGDDITDLSQRVADVFDQAIDYRTDRIARTEVSASANTGATEAYKQAGVEKHQWVVVSPEDEDCKENDGEIVDIGDEFPSGAVTPPDPHPNCECTTIPVF